MLKKFPKLSLLIVLCLALSLLSACSLFKKGNKDSEIDREAADIIQQDEQLDDKKNEQGLNKREEDFLKFGEERLAELITAFNEFGEASKSYQNQVINEGKELKKIKIYKETRLKLLDACHKLETIPLSTVPENLKNFYDQNFRLANHCRQMIYQIDRTNATDLPQRYNTILGELNNYAASAKNYIATIQSQGINAAQGLIAPVDWAAEQEIERTLSSTFDIADFGLNFGSTRAEVMGVEGLIPDYDKLEKLEYNCEVYVYKGVRKYFFNEYDQLYKVQYEFRPNEMNPFNDLLAIFYPLRRSFMVPEYFDTNAMASIQGPDENGQHYFTVDLAHLTATIKATADHPEIPLTVDVEGKLASAEEADN
ncbi:MAG: hypothetical protein Q4P65_03040 [Eubacteriales bacterium]|nr:hypothetical protein [Eubacteriales bacterium]